MNGHPSSPQRKARNIVAEMRSRPRKPVEPEPEPEKTSPIKKLIGGMFSRPSKETEAKPDRASLAEKNQKLAERLEALEDQSWEIRESEELHRSLAEAFGDIIVDRDEAGEIRFANGVAEHYFGSGHPFPNVKLEPVREGSPPVARDIEIKTLRGTRWFSWTDIAMRDGITGDRNIRSVGRDITHRKNDEKKLAAAVEEAENASTVKSRFLAMVSHEMRTPLNGISGMAQLLAVSKLDPAQRDQVEAIKKSGATLLALVNDLLDSAQIEAGQMSLQQEAVDLRKLAERSAEMLASRAAGKGLALSTYVDPALPAQVLLDEARLQQILLNLGGNALKFTQNGGVAIEVTGQATGSKASVTISVRDSGQGLAKPERERIFAEFSQAASGADRQHDGAGLGLFIAQQVAQLMGSAIEVSSIKGRGSRFWLTFETEVVRGQQQSISDPVDTDVALIMPPNPARAALLRSIRAVAGTAHAFDNIDTFAAALKRGNLSLDTLIVDGGSVRGAQNLKLAKQQSPRTILIDHAEARRNFGTKEFDGWLTWPVRLSSLKKVLLQKVDKAPFEPSENQQGEPVPASRSSVLLVEDNDINTLVATRFLERLGCTITHAPDGQHAIATFEEAMKENRHFDHVLLDLNMPDMDGLTVLNALRDLEGEQPHSKVFILTADDREETRQMVLEHRVDGFLTKPLDFDAFANLIQPPQAA